MHSREQANQQASWSGHGIGMLTQEIGINFIPVKRGEWGTEIGILVVIEQTFEACFCVADLCQDENK